MNLNTGDIFTDRRWREYYDVDGKNDLNEEKVKLRESQKQRILKKRKFVEGTIVGILLDMDRGIINFFKDGRDLG